jgi:hypothetical protein
MEIDIDSQIPEDENEDEPLTRGRSSRRQVEVCTDKELAFAKTPGK